MNYWFDEVAYLESRRPPFTKDVSPSWLTEHDPSLPSVTERDWHPEDAA